jgi:septal ring factor EnvC (AmiA/AmiB activator)
MKIPFYISTAASALCLILSLVVFAVSRSNHGIQQDIKKQQQEIQKQQQALQAQQQEIEAGNQISQQIGPNLLRDMAAASVKNEKMKALLAKHGYNVQVNKDAPKDAPAPKP